MSRLRIVFMGTPALAATSLQALAATTAFEILAVATQPDRRSGREMKLHPPPVKELALRAGLRVLQPAKARDEEFIAELRALRPDLIAVAAYGQILPPAILELPRHGCLNVHTSLLPKYRGASPIQAALLNGDSETGVTIMKMDAGLDTGPILSQERVAIEPHDNSQTLHDRLAKAGADLLVKTIPDYVTGKIQPQPQPDEGASHAPKIKKEDGRIDWSQSATAIWNRIRAFTPWPGAFTFLPAQPKPQLLKILKAVPISQTGRAGAVLEANDAGVVIGCGQGALKIEQLQREGGRALNAADFLRGHPLPAGLVLT